MTNRWTKLGAVLVRFPTLGILLANVIHICIAECYVSSNLQSIVAAFSCNTFVYAFVTLSPTVSLGVNESRRC